MNQNIDRNNLTLYSPNNGSSFFFNLKKWRDCGKFLRKICHHYFFSNKKADLTQKISTRIKESSIHLGFFMVQRFQVVIYDAASDCNILKRFVTRETLSRHFHLRYNGLRPHISVPKASKYIIFVAHATLVRDNGVRCICWIRPPREILKSRDRFMPKCLYVLEY